MSISLASFKRAKLVFACSLLLPIATSAVATELRPALKMPKVTQSLLLDVVSAGERIIIVGEKGHIIFSDDQAVTWTQADVPISEMITAVTFVDDKIGWAVGHDGHILQTVNAGQSWTLQRDGLGAQAEANIRQIKDSKVELIELKTQLHENTDELLTSELETAIDDVQWELESAEKRSQTAPIANPLMDVYFLDAKRGWAVGAFGQFLYTKNGGIVWHDATDMIENEMGLHLNAVTGSADGSVYIGGEAGFLYYSHDAGETWIKAELDSESTIFDMKASSDGKAVYTTGLQAKTFRSIDKGVSWSALQTNVKFSLAGVAIENADDFMVVGAGGSVAMSTDGGRAFALSTLPSRVSLSRAMVLKNGQYLIVGEGGIHTFSPNAAEK